MSLLSFFWEKYKGGAGGGCPKDKLFPHLNWRIPLLVSGTCVSSDGTLLTCIINYRSINKRNAFQLTTHQLQVHCNINRILSIILASKLLRTSCGMGTSYDNCWSRRIVAFIHCQRALEKPPHKRNTRDRREENSVTKYFSLSSARHFQPLHNEVKSVLGIKESYSMGKKSKKSRKKFTT